MNARHIVEKARKLIDADFQGMSAKQWSKVRPQLVAEFGDMDALNPPPDCIHLVPMMLCHDLELDWISQLVHSPLYMAVSEYRPVELAGLDARDYYISERYNLLVPLFDAKSELNDDTVMQWMAPIMTQEDKQHFYRYMMHERYTEKKIKFDSVYETHLIDAQIQAGPKSSVQKI